MATEKDETVVIPSSRPKEQQPVSVMPPAPLTPQEQEYQAIASQNGIATLTQKNWAEQQMEAQNVVNGPQQQQTPENQGQQVPGTQQQQPTWLEDWGGGKRFDEIADSSKHPIWTLIGDYNKWAAANNRPPLDYWDYAQLFYDNDPTKSVQENKKEKKRKQWEEAFEHLGDVMMTFGNFVGAAGGAPAPDNMVDPKKLTETQRRRREAAEDQRRAYNKDLLADMFKAREDNYKRDKNAADIARIMALEEAARKKAEDTTRETDSKIGVNNAKEEDIRTLTPEKKKYYQSQTAKNYQQGNAASHNAATNEYKAKNANRGGKNPTISGVVWKQ